MRALKQVLAAFIEATEMTHHTALFKADGLPALRAFLTHQAVFGLVIFF